MRVQDEERRKIARELHDSMGQYLVGLKMNLSKLKGHASSGDIEVLTDSREMLDQCLLETRTISYLLHPPLLDESGLESAARWYLEGFSKRSGIEVRLQISGGLGRQSQEVETALFGVLQESLTNVHRHSGSKKVDVEIRRSASKAPTNLRCPLPARCATNLVADVEVGSRCLLIFFRRSRNTKSYTSTSQHQTKVQKHASRCSIFAMESS